MNIVKFLLVLILALAIAIGVLALRPTKRHSSEVPGFTALRNDTLAFRHAPIVYAGRFEQPNRLLYRAARDSGGRIHIAYHFVWPGERNNGPGFGPWLNRAIYTGGIGLQGIMFGRGDLEMVSVVIGKDGVVEEFAYETAADYDPRSFGVRHKTIRAKGAGIPKGLRVMSWNHLFEPVTGTEESPENGQRALLRPEYFTRALWEDYTMFKPSETFFRRSRAHEPFERLSLP